MYNNYVSESTGHMPVFTENAMSKYALETYVRFIAGDDAAVEELDSAFMMKMEQEKDAIEKHVDQLKEELVKKEGELVEKMSMPSEMERLEKDKAVLEKDVTKLQAIVSGVTGQIRAVENAFKTKREELEAKEGENIKICEENKELKKMIESQVFNARYAERIKRELQAVEREAGEAENTRNAWEEQSWDLDSKISHRFKELEGLSMECNQALRRLKLGDNLQYQLNVKGTTPAEVLGIDYKVQLKPILETFVNEIKKSSIERLDELTTLQRQSVELANRIEEKNNRIASLEKHIDEVEHNLALLKKEIEDHISRCEMENIRVVQDFEAEVHNLENVEKEWANMLKAANLNLQNTVKQTKEDTQKCAIELFKLVDSVSKYKEHAASKIARMTDDLSQTAEGISKVYKGSLPSVLLNSIAYLTPAINTPTL